MNQSEKLFNSDRKVYLATNLTIGNTLHPINCFSLYVVILFFEAKQATVTTNTQKECQVQALIFIRLLKYNYNQFSQVASRLIIFKTVT